MINLNEYSDKKVSNFSQKLSIPLQLVTKNLN